MKLKSITVALGQQQCSRCQEVSYEGWIICAFDDSCWYVCEECMQIVRPKQEIIDMNHQVVTTLRNHNNFWSSSIVNYYTNPRKIRL